MILNYDIPGSGSTTLVMIPIAADTRNGAIGRTAPRPVAKELTVEHANVIIQVLLCGPKVLINFIVYKLYTNGFPGFTVLVIMYTYGSGWSLPVYGSARQGKNRSVIDLIHNI